MFPTEMSCGMMLPTGNFGYESNIGDMTESTQHCYVGFATLCTLDYTLHNIFSMRDFNENRFHGELLWGVYKLVV
jgi:hypothetical protein